MPKNRYEKKVGNATERSNARGFRGKGGPTKKDYARK